MSSYAQSNFIYAKNKFYYQLSTPDPDLTHDWLNWLMYSCWSSADNIWELILSASWAN